jgi:Root cap
LTTKLAFFHRAGVPGKHYCLVSDSLVHVNVFYDGRFDVWGNNTHKPLTWIRKVGILWGKHTIELEAREGSEWKYQNGYMSRILVDGREVSLNSQGESATFDEGKIEILWAAAKQRSGDDYIDVYHVTVGNTLKMIAKIRPEVALLRTNEDGIVHFTLEFPVLHLSENVHGVLGQTYRPDHKDRL